MTFILQIGKKTITQEELPGQLARYRLLPQLAREIIVDQAIAEIDCTPEEIQQIKQRLFQRERIQSEEQYQRWCEKQGMTPQQIENFILRDLKVEKYKQNTWNSKLEAYFLENKRQLDKVVYSLIRTKDAGVAQELYFRIEEGEETFSEVATKYSQGTEAKTGGLVGPVELNVPHPKIAQMLMSSQPKQLLPPTSVGEWWVLLRLEQYQSAQLDEPTKRRLLGDLFQKWLVEEMASVKYGALSTENLALGMEPDS